MVINFEEFTEPLTDREKELIPYFYNFFVGECVGIKNIKISDHLITWIKKILFSNGIDNTGIDRVLLGKIVHILRVEKLIPNLIATSKGYYVATEDAEILNGIESMRQRANSINAAADGMEAGFREGRCIRKKGKPADLQSRILFPE